MTYQQKDGEGSLFVNDRKQTSQHPDYSGSILIGGTEYWLSGWKKSSKDGTKKYLSLSARPKVQKSPSAPKAEPKEDGPNYDLDDALPF